MKASELIDKLSQVSPDTEVVGGVWNGKADTYTVLNTALDVPYDSVYADFFGTPGHFDHRLMDIKSKDVVYLGSTFEDSLRVIDDRRFLWRLAAIQRMHALSSGKRIAFINCSKSSQNNPVTPGLTGCLSRFPHFAVNDG